MKPIIYTPILKREAPVNALQDPSTITGGRRYNSGFNVTPRPLGIADGRPYYGHKGVDLNVLTGTPLYAPFDTNSIWTTTNSSDGNRIVLTVGTIKMGLNHLSGFVKKNTVQKGDLIGFSGNTGNSNGPHLHVDIFSTSGVCYDALPYVMGVWDMYGKDVSISPNQQFYKDTDPYEYDLPSPAQYVVDISMSSLNIRERPGTDKKTQGYILNGESISIDRRCDLPNKELWGRLKDRPWHWVCLFNGKKWLVKDAPKPANRYFLNPPKVYIPNQNIQGYSEPEWSGGFRDIAFKDSEIEIVERYDTAEVNKFGRTKDGIWYLLFSIKYGWAVSNRDDS